MNVISLYFALWVTVDRNGADILYGAALSLSMLAVAVSAPLFGAMSDRSGKRRAPLIAFTLLSVAGTALIGMTDNLWLGLLAFICANYCYHAALVFYDGMLPWVARGANVGKISGYGVSLGYLGAIVGLLAVRPFVEVGGRPAAFLVTAVLFLAFAIPCFLFVSDPPRPANAAPQGTSFKEAFITLKKTWLEIRNYRLVFKFLMVHFLILDVVNTIIAFMSVYANKVMGFSDAQINTFLITSTVAAMLGSLLIGWLCQRKGPETVYALVLWIWVAALALAVASPTQAVFWCVGPLAGIGMGGIWTVSRALLIQWAPPEKLCELFGFYGMAGKMASILGPLLWGGIVWLLSAYPEMKYRAAVFSLMILALGSIVLYRSLIREFKPTSTPS
ncbi:MAG: MFS transporter [Candidatus Nitrohelix vancouverensis]|uniref:MFS transporter n=1 Tax=Candidatus Nitrohelix vancouverensis TaxID=2705534 RepID=A0A7T0C551_9BACT|nr:MAG: MFS transporter [Candidatus Nitrohelix vancouverensis]